MARSPLRILLIALAFLTSGFTSLVLQVAWFKSLAVLLGSTLYAMSTVVAVFLGGLAIGAALAGRFAGRLPRPLVGYGLLEVGIGLYAFVSLPLLHSLDPLASWSYATWGAGTPLYLAGRIALSAVLLLPPTLLMGATLPWLVSWGVRSGREFGRSLGLLYGVNTLGAVLGASTAGFWIIPWLGLRGATYAVGALALAVGVILALWGAREGRLHPPVAPAPSSPALRLSVPAIVLIALSGAVALLLEVAWARVFSLIFGSSVYSFSLVLAAYLLGIAVGSLLWGGRLADSRRPWLAFAGLQALAATGVAVGLWMIPGLPERFISILLNSRQNLPLVYVSQAGLAGLVAFLPCLALGALFPVSARLLGGDRGDAGRVTGLSYAINTAGTVTGSLLAGFVLVPLLGVQNSLTAAVWIAALLGLAALWFDPQRRLKKPAPSRPHRAARGQRVGAVPILVVALGSVAVVLALAAPEWNRGLFTLGLYRSATGSSGTNLAGVRAEIQSRLDDELILYYREGLHSVVSVHTVRSIPTALTIRVNGKPDASTGNDMRTQLMIGHLPMLLAEPGAEVCVIGHGSGVTAASVLAHAPSSLTIVEIEPAVIEASRFFEQVNEHVLDRPEVELLIEDGRLFLQHSGRQFDVIISQPPNPWMAGVNNLFTVDYYRRVRAALRPEGVFCAWLQTYELSAEAVSSLLAAFDAAFPHAQAFLFERDLLLVAHGEGSRVSAERLISRSRPQASSPFLSRFGFEEDGLVAANHLGRVSQLRRHLPRAPINSDDRPYVEYRAPLDLFRAEASGGFQAARVREAEPASALTDWTDGDEEPRVLVAAATRLAEEGRLEEARAFVTALEGWPELSPALLEEAQRALARGEASAPATPYAESAKAALEAGSLPAAFQGVQAALAIDPRHGLANLVAGRLSMREEELASAREHLVTAIETGNRGDRCVAWINLGILEMREGHSPAGLEAFQEALATLPGEPAAYINLARWYASSGQVDSARVVLERGRRVAFPSLPVEQALSAQERGEPF